MKIAVEASLEKRDQDLLRLHVFRQFVFIIYALFLTANSEEEEKEEEKEKKNRRNRSSSLSTTDDEGTDGRFAPKCKDDQNSWKLPKEQAKYVIKHFNTYINDKTLKESILESNPVPSNVGRTLKLDNYMKSLLKQAGKSYVSTADRDWAAVQKKVFDILGPVTSLWSQLENFKNGRRDGRISQSELGENIEQTIVLLGQVNNAVNYHRRLNVLSALQKNQRSASSTLQEEYEFFKSPSKHLFGSSFENSLHKKAKHRKQSKDLLISFDDSPRKTSQFPKANRDNPQPFRRGPSASRSGYSGGHNIGRGAFRGGGSHFNASSKRGNKFIFITKDGNLLQQKHQKPCK